MAKDWYDVLHPHERAKAEKPEPVVNKLAAWFAAEYGDEIAEAAAEPAEPAIAA